MPSLVLALGWGALWAPVLGAWAVFPHFLRTQRIHPASLSEWMLLDGLLLAVFAGFGLIGALVAWVVLGSWCRWRGRPFHDPNWALALCVPLFLPPLYFLTSALTELVLFRNLVGLSGYEPYASTVATLYSLVGALAILFYRQMVRRTPRPRPPLLAVSAVFALVVGVALTTVWSEPALDPEAAKERLRVSAEPGPRPPLLFVGVDSGSWKILRALIDEGKAPTLRRLMDAGISGEVHADWPPPIWSAPAWAAILTGYGRRETGIHQELAAVGAGLPPFQVPLEFDFLLDPLYLVEYKIAARLGYLKLMPFPRSALLRQPVWELLQAAGLRTAVVRFRFTYPAENRASFVISDFVGADVWALMGIWTQVAGAIAPPEMSDALLAPFSGPAPDADALVSSLLPRGGPEVAENVIVSPADTLRIAAEIDVRTLAASLALLRAEPSIDAFFVYLGGFDTVCHAFWRYRFPNDFPEDPTDPAAAEEFGPVIDRYLEFVDTAVGKLIAAYATPPNVLIVADHGHDALHGNRTYTGAHSTGDAIFLAAGPTVPHRAGLSPVSYFDVTPTILDLLGFAPLSTMGGASRLSSPTESISPAS